MSASRQNDAVLQLGLTLRSLRKTEGITSYLLASQLGIHATRLSRIENGKIIPKRGELLELLGHLNLDMRIKSEVLRAFDGIKEQTSASKAKLLGIGDGWNDVPAHAKRYRWFAQTLVPPILQAAGYVSRLAGLCEDMLTNEALAERMKLQDLLFNQEVQHEFVISNVVCSSAMKFDHSHHDGSTQQQRIMQISLMENISMSVIQNDVRQDEVPQDLDFVIVDDDFVKVKAAHVYWNETSKVFIQEYTKLFGKLLNVAQSIRPEHFATSKMMGKHG